MHHEIQRIHYFQHVPFEGLGSMANWIADAGHHLTSTHFYRGDPLPSPQDIDWLIVMGGPMGVYDTRDYPWLETEKDFIRQAVELQKTVVGVCLGAQLLASALGASVYPNPQKEIGWFPIQPVEAGKTPLADVFGEPMVVFHWHGDTFDLPTGAIHLASSEVCKHQAFLYGERAVGLQFHLETTLASAQDIITHCQGEIVDAPYIQSAASMLADDAPFAAINGTMKKLLDRLAGR